jgi:hypothetical protein
VIDAAVEAGAFAGAAEVAGALFDALGAPEDGIALASALEKGGETPRAVEALHRVAALPEGPIGEPAQRVLGELGRELHLAAIARPLLARAAPRPMP